MFESRQENFANSFPAKLLIFVSSKILLQASKRKNQTRPKYKQVGLLLIPSRLTHRSP